MPPRKTPNMRLKKAPRVARKGKPKLYCLLMGTPNQFAMPGKTEAESTTYHATEHMARKAAATFFHSQESWCNRFNREGLLELQEAMKMLDGMSILYEPRTITALLDKHTGFMISVKLWKRKEPTE